MNKLMLATAIVTALSSGSLMAKEWKEVRIGVEGAYPPFSWTEPSGEVKVSTSTSPTPCARR